MTGGSKKAEVGIKFGAGGGVEEEVGKQEKQGMINAQWAIRKVCAKCDIS